MKHIEPAFTNAERETIAQQESAAEVFAATWDTILRRHGTSLELEDSITPWEYSITEPDTVWVIKQLLDREPTGTAWVMLWANQGPSSHDGSEVKS